MVYQVAIAVMINETDKNSTSEVYLLALKQRSFVV